MNGIHTRGGKILASVAVMALLAAAAVGVTFTPLFAARTIRVDGASHLSVEKVLEVAGVSPETNVWHADPAALEGALESDPWVRSALVTRELPSTLTIAIEERHPVAVLGRGGAVVAEDGVRLPGVRDRRLPVLEALTGSLDRESLLAGASALGALSRGVLVRVAAARVASVEPRFVSMELRGGTEITYGPAVEVAAKAGTLRAMLVWGAANDATFRTIDVRVPDAPAAELSDGGTYPAT